MAIVSFAAFFLMLNLPPAEAAILYRTGDATANTAAPESREAKCFAAESGWKPNFRLTAFHIRPRFR